MRISWRRLFSGAAAVVLAGGLTATASFAGPRETGSNKWPVARSFITTDSSARRAPLPFLKKTLAAQRRIHHSPVNDPTADFTDADAQLNTQIVDLGNGRLVAAWGDSGSFDGINGHFIGYAWSDDGGLSWNDSGALPDNPLGENFFPSLAADKTSGAVYLAAHDFGETTVQVFKSTDEGHTFGAPVLGSPDVGSELRAAARIAVDNRPGTGQGNVYLCWTEYDPGIDVQTIRFSASTDGGATFAPAAAGTLISNGGDFCFVAVGASHQVYVFYYRGSAAYGIGGNNRLFMRRSVNRGASFSAEVQVTDLGTTSFWGDLGLRGFLSAFTYPTASVSPQGYVYTVFHDDPTPTDPDDDNGDIYVARSKNNGTSFITRQRVNDDRAGDQFNPSVAFSADGAQVLFTYYTRSHDPAGLLYHRRGRIGTVGLNGRIAFKPSFQLSPNMPIAADDPFFCPCTGEYDGSDSADGGVVTTWTDTRLASDFHLNQPDVRFANVQTNAPATNFGITLAASAPSAELGEDIAFVARLISWDTDANDVFFSVTAPFGMALRSVSAPGGQCTIVDNTAGCSLGVALRRQPKTVHMVLTPVLETGVRAVTAYATASNDRTPGNNVASVNITVTNATIVSAGGTTGNVSIPIPDADPAGVTVDFTVPLQGTAVQAVPSIRLDHTFDSDLDIYLISPTGRVVLLSSDNGGDGDNYGAGPNSCAGTPTTFSDLAATSIVDALPPFDGTLLPQEAIAGLLGGPADGRWSILVEDAASGDDGTIGCVSLDLRVAR